MSKLNLRIEDLRMVRTKNEQSYVNKTPDIFVDARGFVEFASD